MACDERSRASRHIGVWSCQFGPVSLAICGSRTAPSLRRRRPTERSGGGAAQLRNCEQAFAASCGVAGLVARHKCLRRLCLQQRARKGKRGAGFSSIGCQRIEMGDRESGGGARPNCKLHHGPVARYIRQTACTVKNDVSTCSRPLPAQIPCCDPMTA